MNSFKIRFVILIKINFSKLLIEFVIEIFRSLCVSKGQGVNVSKPANVL